MPGAENKRLVILLAGLLLASLILYLLIYLYPDFWNHNSEYEWKVLWHGRRSKAAAAFLLWMFILSAAFLARDFLGQKIVGKKLDLFSGGLIFLLGIASPLVFMQANRFGSYELLVRVLVSDHTGYFTDALKFKGRADLEKAYRGNLLSLSTHSRTHPPTNALLFMALNRAGKKSELLQDMYRFLVKEDARQQIENSFGVDIGEQTGAMLALMIMLGAGAFSGVLGYFLLRNFYSPSLCFVSCLALVSMPPFSAKAPVMDQVFAVFILGSSLIAVSSWKRMAGKGILAGLLIGAGVWLSPAVWSAPVLMLFLAAAAELKSEPRKGYQEIFKSVLVVGGAAIIAFCFMILLMSLFAGMSYPDVYRINRMGWHLNNAASGRTAAWKWIIFNPYEYLLWSSLIVAAGFAAKLWQEARKLCPPDKQSEKIDPFFALSLAFISLLNISAQVCYESPRLCWFFLPFMACYGMAGFAGPMKNLHNRLWLLIFGLISLQTTLFILIY